MDKILHDPKDPKLWELWYIPYYGSCRILSINRIGHGFGTPGLEVPIRLHSSCCSGLPYRILDMHHKMELLVQWSLWVEEVLVGLLREAPVGASKCLGLVRCKGAGFSLNRRSSELQRLGNSTDSGC